MTYYNDDNNNNHALSHWVGSATWLSRVGYKDEKTKPKFYSKTKQISLCQEKLQWKSEIYWMFSRQMMRHETIHFQKSLMGISNTSKYLQAPFHQHNCIPANKLALSKLNRGVLLKCTKNSTELILKTKWSRASRDEFTKTARSHKWFFLISCNTLLLLLKFQMNEKPSGRKAIIVKQRN